MSGHIEVDDTTSIMGQNQKHVKDLETKSGHGKEVDGDQLLGMILQEGAPGLRRRPTRAHHVLAHAALTDFEAKFEQLTVDAGCTPNRDSLDTSCESSLEARGQSPVVPVGRGAPSRSRTGESRRASERSRTEWQGLS